MVYQERLVIYMDILGFKEKVKASSNDTVLRNNLLNAINHIKNEKSYLLKDSSDINNFQFSFFSDSIIYSAPLENDNYVYFAFVMAEYMIRELSCYGLIVRGGISIGNMHHDGDVAFGEALNEAVCLEQKIAIYPRVIFNSDTYKKIDYRLKKNGAYAYPNDINDFNMLIKPYKNELNETWYYLDFLSQSSEYDSMTAYNEFLNNYKKLIDNGRKEFSNKKHELDKYIWLDNYFKSIKT